MKNENSYSFFTFINTALNSKIFEPIMDDSDSKD